MFRRFSRCRRLSTPVAFLRVSIPAAELRKPRRKHLLLDVSIIIVGVVVVYVLSLLGYHFLVTAPGPLPEPLVREFGSELVVP